MNFLFFLLTGATFINPPTINTTGLYFKGDVDVISIADGSQRRQDYRIPKNSIGAQFKVKLADDSPLNIYVNRDEESFNKVISPPVNELTEEKVHLISLKDEKFVIMMHNQLTQTVANAKNWSIRDTINMINALDKTVQTRAKSSNATRLSKKQIREIRQQVDEAKEQGYFDKLKTTSSVSPRMTQTQSLSDDSDQD